MPTVPRLNSNVDLLSNLCDPEILSRHCDCHWLRCGKASAPLENLDRTWLFLHMWLKWYVKSFTVMLIGPGAKITQNMKPGNHSGDDSLFFWPLRDQKHGLEGSPYDQPKCIKTIKIVKIFKKFEILWNWQILTWFDICIMRPNGAIFWNKWTILLFQIASKVVLGTKDASFPPLRGGAHINKGENSIHLIQGHPLLREKASSMYLFWHFQRSVTHVLSKLRFSEINNKGGPLYIFLGTPPKWPFFRIKWIEFSPLLIWAPPP